MCQRVLLVENSYQSNISITKNTSFMFISLFHVLFYFQCIVTVTKSGNLRYINKFDIFTEPSASIRPSVTTTCIALKKGI